MYYTSASLHLLALPVLTLAYIPEMSRQDNSHVSRLYQAVVHVVVNRVTCLFSPGGVWQQWVITHLLGISMFPDDGCSLWLESLE